HFLELDELLAADGDAAAAKALLGGTSRGSLQHRTRRQWRRNRLVHRARRLPSSCGRLIGWVQRPAEDPARLLERQRARCECVLVAAISVRDDVRDRIAP